LEKLAEAPGRIIFWMVNLIAFNEGKMQIPNEIRKCVAFLACRRNSGYKNGGTVFFVGYPLADTAKAFMVYAITARHVIEEISKRSDGNVYCRLNTKQHGIQYLGIPILSTLNHPDLKQKRDIISQGIPAVKRLNIPVPDNMAELPKEMIIQEDVIARTDSLDEQSIIFASTTEDL
jgi:hypothetical protein